jgi:hypothetical protein
MNFDKKSESSEKKLKKNKYDNLIPNPLVGQSQPLPALVRYLLDERRRYAATVDPLLVPYGQTSPIKNNNLGCGRSSLWMKSQIRL